MNVYVCLMYVCRYFCYFHEIYVTSSMVNNGESITSNFCFLIFFSYLNSYSLLNPEQNPTSIVKYLKCLFFIFFLVKYDQVLEKMWVQFFLTIKFNFLLHCMLVYFLILCNYLSEYSVSNSLNCYP